jgi:hypothetical protein
MSDAQDVLDRYLRAQRDKDLDALVSCWADDIEAVHPMRPDRSWSGIDTYRRAWATIWGNRPDSRFELLSAEVVGDRIYLQALVEHGDGTMVPNMNILEVEDGRIKRATVYTDTPVRDGVDMDRFVDDLNPGDAAPPGDDPVDRFNRALATHDIDLLERACHPDFEMIVPQHPARGFVGRDQEVANIRFLFETYPDFTTTVLRKARIGDEIWCETTASAAGLEMAAVVVWEIDAATDTLRRGRFYSERVEHEGGAIDDFMDSLRPGIDQG